MRGNLQRVKISEYILRLNKNKYPLLDPKDTNAKSLISKSKFKSVNQASSIKFNLHQIIACLDWFNVELTPCHYCNLPYSFDKISSKNVCIFCYIQLIKRPVIFYLQFDNNTKVEAISIHPQGNTVSFPYIGKLLSGNPSQEEIQQMIDEEKSKSEYVEKSLDDFF